MRANSASHHRVCSIPFPSLSVAESFLENNLKQRNLDSKLKKLNFGLRALPFVFTHNQRWVSFCVPVRCYIIRIYLPSIFQLSSRNKERCVTCVWCESSKMLKSNIIFILPELSMISTKSNIFPCVFIGAQFLLLFCLKYRLKYHLKSLLDIKGRNGLHRSKRTEGAWDFYPDVLGSNSGQGDKMGNYKLLALTAG